MLRHGFVRVAAAVPLLRVADCPFNAGQIITQLGEAARDGVQIAVFPELCLTGYTCADLFQQPQLLRAALQALDAVRDATERGFGGLVVVGLPLQVDDQLYNCAAVVQAGRVLGIIPKSYLPNYKEFYEVRWFAPAATSIRDSVRLPSGEVPFGTNQLFRAEGIEGLTVGVEICEDLWVPIPPSCWQALRGATLLVNPSASNELIGKAAYRRDLVVNQSARCVAGYVYTSCGTSESTTDVVFGGHCLVAENGSLVAETRRFRREAQLLVADIDLDRLRIDRLRMNSFGSAQRDASGQVSFRVQPFTPSAPESPLPLRREVDAHPFVPRGEERLVERCEEIFHNQVCGLARRLEHIGVPPVAIGISGGLDSTLALLVTCKTMDALGQPRDRIRALTMPGFGTSSRTLGNARELMRQLGVNAREVDIRGLCLEEMRLLGHRPFGIALEGLDIPGFTERLRSLGRDNRHDLVFENVQARMRTSLLMNTGFVIGTGDLSELALGWCTYNGDHISMYNPNVSIPKTLVRFLVRWAARHEFEGDARQTLLDISDTVISPELLPAGADGQEPQSTEGTVGPYELVDFFLFQFLRYAATPEKILFLAGQAHFERQYTAEELRQWLRVFLSRFFANQFKRSCLPDGPKVGSISLSPRGDWRMPSDARPDVWLQWLDREAPQGGTAT